MSKKTHPNLEKAIKLLLEKGYSERRIARTYLVSRTLVRKIKFERECEGFAPTY